MSNAPYLMHGARDGLRFGHASLQDSMIQDGLWDAFNDYHMGITAENLADAFDISRERRGRLRRQLPAQSGGRYRRRALSRGDRPGQRPAGQTAAASRD